MSIREKIKNLSNILANKNKLFFRKLSFPRHDIEKNKKQLRNLPFWLKFNT